MKFFYNIELIYNGQNYYGWQKQKSFVTIQGTVEKILQKISNTSKIKTIASSRTDTAVHSKANVCFIKIEEDFDPHDLLAKLNDELPEDIRVSRCERTYNHFKVIYFAEKKQYLYLFKNSPSNIPSHYFHNIEQPLNIEKMKEAASTFIGTHDFTNFCHKVAKTTEKIRTINRCEIIENQRIISENGCEGSYALLIEGNGFLKQMVRIIMGSLINVGLGLKDSSDLVQALNTTEYVKAGFIAPGSGLYLNKIDFIRDPFKGLKSKKKKNDTVY